MFYPKVRLKGVEAPEAKLLWQKVKRGEEEGGEVLIEAELFLVRDFRINLFSLPMHHVN